MKSPNRKGKKGNKLKTDVYSNKMISKSNLMYLNLSHNNLGPKCFHSLMACLNAKNSTLTSLGKRSYMVSMTTINGVGHSQSIRYGPVRVVVMRADSLG